MSETAPQEFTLITDEQSFAGSEPLTMHERYPVLAGKLGERAVDSFDNNDLNKLFKEDYPTK